ncbi:MAG TPA: UDP-N-acetylmuramoyl-L-alanyl-D-glutamate--2,6-diaminopimelate ligase, partial [Fimbriimonadaceae bacterium]|nr:UDP-N-acetylmuramoyl-L-alanyl-D-glutamate--2,6-diaminopimelate ligase [Fimbriimonadaceae bacterium]
MKVVGVTGTNGKTTTAWLVRDIFRNLGERAAYLGTLGFHTPDEQRELSNTTPNPVELYKLLAEARDKSVDVLAMEVSSHALAERRAEGVEYDAVVFTNLTQDHLDFHGSMEDYESAKSRLFIELPEQTEKTVIRCLNMDDPVGESWFEKLGATDYLTFSSADSSWDVYGGKVEVSIDRIGMDLYYSGGREFDQPLSVRAPLGGYFNVENLLAAITAALACGVPYNDLLMPLQNVRPVPGRFEPVQNSSGIGIIVDYAHTPDALAKVLDTARELTRGRLTCVFGCGGDRDRTKRPLMGAAASERADVCVLTSDNPRTEDPEAILRDVERGIRSGSDHVTIIDRREAVAHAIADAKPGDTVVIAGKGHENYQIIGRTKYPMDDRSLAREALEARCAR